MTSTTRPKLPRSSTGAGGKAVDVLTGKEKVEYFFDPTLALPDSNRDSSTLTTPSKSSIRSLLPSFNSGEKEDSILYSSPHLYLPCSIIKTLDDVGNTDGNESVLVGALVKLNDGTLHKIRDSSKLTRLISPEDYIGVDDVLHLPHITEASLLHALRLRYKRDDIYTNAGPILISVNPYKVIKSNTSNKMSGRSVDKNSPGVSSDGGIAVGGTGGIYSEQKMMQYRNSSKALQEPSMTPHSSRIGHESLPPHLFGVADRAYTALLSSVNEDTNFTTDKGEEDSYVTPKKVNTEKSGAVNQSIIISGESGAGKTEATKIIMQYLARITQSNFEKSEDKKSLELSLEDRVLSSNPLLESFGNSRTLKNDNSSRFGKFIQISFDLCTGTIAGAKIENYLLEKTRITTQADGERNYHIFYQLLLGAETSLLEDLQLSEGSSSFKYLGNREMVKNRTDSIGFSGTKDCLKGIGLNVDDQKVIFQVVAAVLHIGNVEFECVGGDDTNSDNAMVAGESNHHLITACQLLGLDESDVKEAILTKLLSIGGKTIKKPQDVPQAIDKRDALAKMVYSSLFLWLVHRINKTIASTPSVTSEIASVECNLPRQDRVQMPHGSELGFIGVLDIYGFESFQENGFEQLLINYANEKLQRHFNRHLFEVEQDLYSSEGVDWTYITFNDNKPCLELIEGGGGTVGILSTLDDSWGGMGTASEKDVKFVSHLHQLFGGAQETSTSIMKKKKNGGNDTKHPNYIQPKFGNDRQFIVIHYAGEVRYTANGFVEKNVESLSNELKDLGINSSIPLSKEMFQFSAEGIASFDNNSNVTTRRSTIRGVSVASQFRSSLNALVVDLEETQPWYIRCIKPNLTKSSNTFEAGEVLRQLRYAGMMEAIRIRREGYAHREAHESFYKRLHILLDADDRKEGEGIAHLVSVLSKRLSISDADWQIGHSKIFLRRELANKLETLALLKIQSAARTVGRFCRKVARSRASALLIAWSRLRIYLLRKYRKEKAATKIQSTFRMKRQRLIYAAIQFVAIRLQSLERRRLAVLSVEKMRDPYADLSFRELQQLYNSENDLLENAVKTKNFKLAGELKVKLEALKEAIEEKRPLTRSVLDAMIKEAEKKLDDAVSKRDFALCPDLQSKLNELLEKKKDFPTISELRQYLFEAESALASAVACRDFSGAVSKQSSVDTARERLEKALELEGGADKEENSSEAITEDNDKIREEFKTRTELETKIESTKNTLDKAIAEKHFKEASTHQQHLDDLEALRCEFPTIKEMTTELSNKVESMSNAINKKDFREAERIQEAIDKLETKIEAEKTSTNISGQSKEVKMNHESIKENNHTMITLHTGETKQVNSRAELNDVIRLHEEKAKEAAAKKNFDKASEIQNLVNNLEEKRQNFPTLMELNENLDHKEDELDKAMKKKDFKTAGQLHEEIKELKNSINAEQRNSDQEKKKYLANSTNNNKKVLYAKSSTKHPFSNNQSTDHITGKKASKETKKTKTQAGVGAVVSSSLATPNKVSDSVGRTVSKLRPRKPLISNDGETVLAVTQMLANKRGSAALIVGSDGSLTGIITDTDITRRVVAKTLDPSSTSVSVVMTANPTVVSMKDSAMDALGTMVENHFRHLPVVDDQGAIVGVLDIAKCLNDAISKLKKSQNKGSSAAEDAVKQMAALQGAGGSQAAVLTKLLGPLMSQAFGGSSSPTLRSLLAGKPSTIVPPNFSLEVVGKVMAESKKAALVVDNGELIGIFGFKDMMTRAVAKKLPLDLSPVESVMTPDPEAVSPDMTVVEALELMHESKFLNLPVCENDGRVCGLVNVMDLIYGCGGAEGWRALFDSAMDATDDVSDSVSLHSSSILSRKSNMRLSSHRKELSSNIRSSDLSLLREDGKPVSKLRPRKPTFVSSNDSIFDVCRSLYKSRSSAAIVVDRSSSLLGIITDHDITRRVVAKQIDPSLTLVSAVMTPNPSVVYTGDSAIDALNMMIENHYRYLPVLDEYEHVTGVLDIGKCLNDAIAKLEKSIKKCSSSTQDVLDKMTSLQSNDSSDQAVILRQMLGPIMLQAFGSNSSTLRNLVSKSQSTVISTVTTIEQAAVIMADSHKATLVAEHGQLIGIVSFKDIMCRAIAQEIPMNKTPVTDIMTADPEFANPDMTIVEAMQLMHENKFLTLPVCEDDGTILGVVDVMDLIYGAGGADGWQSVFHDAMDIDDSASGNRSSNSASFSSPKPVIRVSPETPYVGVPSNVPNQVVFTEGNDESHSLGDSIDRTLEQSFVISSLDRTMPQASNDTIMFKVIDNDGHKYLIRCQMVYTKLLQAVKEKIDHAKDLSEIKLKFIDDEGDIILISSDNCLEEAVNLAKEKGNQAVRLLMTFGDSGDKVFGLDQSTLSIAAGAFAIGIGLISLMKSRK